MNDMYTMISMEHQNDETSNTMKSSSIQEETLINEYGDDDWASPMDSTNRMRHPKLQDNKLDLHGCSHQEVIDTIENILILQYNTGNWPLEVITGNSQKMKSLVIKHAYSRGFNTKAPVNDNPGSIIVF